MMRPRARRLAVVVAAATLTACAGLPSAFRDLGAQPPAAGGLAKAGTGRLRLAIKWPDTMASGYRAQLIPDSTATLKVIVKKGTTEVSTTNVNRPSGQSVTNTTISLHADTGLTVLVEAYPSGANSGTKIAEKTTSSVEIKSSVDTNLSVTLDALYTPAISSGDNSNPGAFDSLTLTGTNFAPAWRAAGPIIKFTSTTASVSVTPSSVSDTSLTLTVPEGVITGSITAVSDGVESGTFQLSIDSGVSTLAGSTFGYVDDTGTAAKFWRPAGLAFTPSGDLVVAEDNNHTIRSVSATAVVTTIAGGGGSDGFVDQTGTSARFRRPIDVAVDSSGTIYVADFSNSAIRKIVGTTVSTLAGAGTFLGPAALELDAAEQNLYVAEYTGHRIRKIELSSQNISTYAGTGSSGLFDSPNPLLARFGSPHGIAFDPDGNLYVVEYGNRTIRQIAAGGGAVSTLLAAGTLSGPTYAEFKSGALYVTDYDGHSLWKVVTTTGAASKVFGGVAGSADGALSVAQVGAPLGIAIKASPFTIYITDGQHRIRRVRP